MNYTLHQLRVFVKVTDCQSISRAADLLHLTQPAVSIQVKRLQDQFDIPLTEVIGRQLYITEFGNQIAEKCRKILEETEGIKSLVDRYKGMLSGKIHIASVSTGKYVIPYFLTGFMALHPQIEMNIDVTNKQKVIASLQENSTDFALVSVVPDQLKVERLELLPNRLYLVGSSKHALVEQQSVALGDLGKHAHIFREEGSATRAAMEQFLSQNNIDPARSMELVSNEAVKQAVNAGLGISIMPLIGLKNELGSSMEIIPVKGLPITTTWFLVYSKGKNLSPACEALLEFITAHKEEVREDVFSWTRQY